MLKFAAFIIKKIKMTKDKENENDDCFLNDNHDQLTDDKYSIQC